MHMTFPEAFQKGRLTKECWQQDIGEMGKEEMRVVGLPQTPLKTVPFSDFYINSCSFLYIVNILTISSPSIVSFAQEQVHVCSQTT